MRKNKHYYTFHHRILWFITVAFATMAMSFVVILYTNEKELKENLLFSRLIGYNDYLNMKIVKGNDVDSVLLKNFLQTSVFDLKGNVLYDSRVKDYSLLKNESNFQEVRHALTKGQGYDDRKVKGYEDSFFYAAKRYNNIVIRSALPIDVSFIGTIKENALYLSGLLLFFILLEFFLFKSMFHLGRNINRLNEFAVRVDRDEVIEYSAKFSKNELGEVAQHIIQIYNRLMQTKKALEVEKERVIAQQEEQVRLKRQLTQNVAHELKTPVSSIQGYLETIVNNTDIPDETKSNFIDKSYSQCKRLAALLQDISYLSRIEEAPDMIEKEHVVLSDIIANVFADVANQVASKMIVVKNSTTTQRLECKGSPSLLYSIFRNLIDNTIAYAGEGVEVCVDCYKEDEHYLYFSYSDNGVGVPDEHLARIFERFYRLDKGRSRKLGGTGLGLAIVKNAIIFHGGTVTAKKLYGGGLEFVFTIGKNG